MPQAVDTSVTSRSPTRPSLLGGLLLGGCVIALAGSVLLWAHYGTTVFFETIRAGFTACFG